jgi:hypothetical protein
MLPKGGCDLVMNVAQPLLEGKAKSAWTWPCLIFEKNMKLCEDWGKVRKKERLGAMAKGTCNGVST